MFLSTASDWVILILFIYCGSSNSLVSPLSSYSSIEMALTYIRNIETMQEKNELLEN